MTKRWEAFGSVLLLAGALVGCAGGNSLADAGPPDADAHLDAVPAPDSPDAESPALPPFVAVTFNTGTGGFAPNDGNDGYHAQQAAYCDELYGNGLSWMPFVEKTRDWFAQVDPDVVVFQEIFHAGDCPDIPAEAQTGFICEHWQPGDPTVLELLLPEPYQLACHPGHPDKCAAVHERFGTFRGCDERFCLEGLAGSQIDGCGHGARIGRAVIELAQGGTLTLVNVHGSSGFTDDDMACRVKQFEQIFVDLGDGEPAANGARNLIMGDFNTDPGRLAASDPSAARINDFAGPGKPFHFVTRVGEDAPPTYGVLNIDHVISDALTGDCRHPGMSEDYPPVMDALFFDHLPAVCLLEVPAP